jgi:maltoporin
MHLKFTLVAAAALATLSTTASAVDWDGYFRVGPGGKSPSDCYDIGGGSDGLKYRLGNECNTYGEFGLGQKARLGNVDVKAYLMTNFYQPGSDVGSQKVGVEQMYAEAKGFDIAPDQTFWVGQRFYGRTDVHIVDTFFVNMTGTGAGVEGFDFGGGAKLNLAVFRNDSTIVDGTGNSIPTTNNLTRLNADLVKLPLNPGGTLRVTGTITHGTAGAKNGSGISFQHNQDGILGGANTLWLQFAKGTAGLNAGNGDATATSAAKSWRIVESMQWVTGPLTGQALAVYANHKDNTGLTTKDSTIGGRMAYALTNNFKLQGELGLSRIKPDGGETQNLTKFTIAPTLTVGPNFYDRPEFRLYATFAHLNDAAILANPVYTKNSDHSFGVQVEMWF